MRKPAGSWIEPDVAARASSSDGTGGHHAQAPVMGERTRMRQGRMAVVAIGVALVALPLLVVVLIFALRSPKEPASAAVTTASSPMPVSSERREAQAPIEDPAADAEPGEGGGPAVSSAEPATSSPPSPPAWTGRPPTTSKPPAQSKTADKPKPKTEDKPAAGGTGTLVAIAIGGKCAFSVDGASKGSGSSISVQVPLGSHTVTCAPKGSGPRSQTVTVKEGKPGMATFKLK